MPEVPRADRGQVGRAEVRRRRRRVRVAGRAARAREELRAGHRRPAAASPASTQRGTSAITSEASASFAVAPFHVSTPIETIDEHRGDDRDRPPREPPLAAQVDERQRDAAASSAIVGTPTVPRNTDSGHLKIRSR